MAGHGVAGKGVRDLRQRLDGDLDAAVAGLAFGGSVGGNRFFLATAFHGEAVGIELLGGEVTSDRRGAAAREIVVVVGRAIGVRVADDVDQRLVILLENDRHGIMAMPA